MALQQVNGTIHSLVKTEEEWLGISTVIPKNQWVYVQVQNEEGATEFYGKLGDGEHTFVDLPKAMLNPSEVRAIAQAVVDSKADQSALDETNVNVEALSTKVEELNTSVEETQSSVSTLQTQYNAVLEQVETLGTEIDGTVKLSSETAQIIDSDIVLGEGHSLKGADEESLVRLATVDSGEEGTRSNGVQTELGNIVNHTNILSSDRPTVTLADKAEQLAFVSDIDASVSAELEQEITDRQEADQALEDKITELSTSTEESLALKADKATTLAGYGITDAYNKADVDGKLALKLDTEVASTTYATKSELDAKVSSVYKYKGSVATEEQLPQEGNVVGDVYNVESDGSNYAWDGTAWDKLGGDVDLTAYLTKEEAGTTYATKAEIPTKLPNPEALTVTVNKKSFVTYDGSTAVTQDLVMNAETIPLNADTTLTVAYGLEEVTPLVAQVPIRSLQDKVYDQETILGWFSQESVADLKQKIVRNAPVFVKYGIQLSGNPHFYKFPVEYCAFESNNQIKMVFQGLNTKDDVVSKYEIIINLDGTVIEGNSNVKVTITSLENKPGASSYNELTDKPSINNVELSGNKTLENLGIQPAGEYLVSADIVNKADKATTLAGYGIEDAYTKSQIDTSLSTKLSSQEASSTYATITSVEVKADKATTLAGYGITDAFTKNEVNTALGAKLDSATASTTYATKQELNSKVASVYKVKGSVANQAALPEESNEVGDVYNVEDTGINYVWTGEEWDALGGSIDLTNYYTKGDVDSKLANKANTADVYSKTVLDPMLEAKVDSADLGTMAYAETTDYSTKAVADTLYAPISLSETVAGKADSATTLEGYGITDAYTSSEVDAKLAEKASTADVEAIEEVVPETASTSNMLVDAASLQSKLNAKADSETVSQIQSTLLTKADKSEIPSKLPNPQSFTLQMNGTQVATYDGSTAQTGNVVVNATTVPMSGEDETTVSEALALKANTADVYTQTAADGKFALKTDVSTISGKIPEEASTENKLVDKNAMNTALAGKANTSDLGTMASKNADDYSTTEEANALYAPASISTSIEGKADKADTLAGYGITDAYTKSQVDTELGKKLDSTTASSTYATQSSVSTISGKIPEAASTDNLLVDTNAMNTALAGKANSAEVYTKVQVDAKVSSVYKYKGSVATESALPQEGNTTGDVYNVEDTGMNYAWDGTAWDKLGGDIDLTSYLTKEEAGTTYAKITTVNGKADKATTLAGYGIEDAYTKSQVDTELGKKLDVTTATSTYATITTVSGIEEVIPEEASSDNQLVTSDTLSEYSTKSVADTLYAAKSVESTVSSLSTKVDGKADKATTLEGYGITDAYTSSEVDSKLSAKLDTATASSTYATVTTVNGIEEVIPEEASTENKLVDTNAMTSALADKANASDLGTMASKNASDYSTKAVADTLYAAKSVEGTVSTLTTTVASKANTADVYTQTAADAKFALKTDVSTISGKIPEAASADNKLVDNTSMTSALALKANSADVYTKGDVDSKLSAKLDSATATSTYATITTVNAKADADDVYTKDEVDTELGKKLDSTTASSTYATQSSLTSHTSNTENPHSVTKAQVGLGNVDNTSDANKPISTATQAALNLKANSADVYTKSQVDTELAKKLDSTTASSTYATKTELSQQVASVYKVKGSVATESALPQEGNTTGDVYNVETDGMNYVWDGTQWDKLGGTVDLSNYYTKSQVDTELGKKLDITTASSTYLTQTTASSTYATVQALNAKADASDVTSIEDTIATYGTMATKNADDYSTKAVADTLYAPASLSGTVSTLSTTVSGKANASEVYTKTVADSTFATKTELGNKVDTSALGNATITIKVNGSSVGTFTTNQLANSEVDITVPTQTSQLTNNSKFVTGESVTGIQLFASKEEAQAASALNPTLMCLYPD